MSWTGRRSCAADAVKRRTGIVVKANRGRTRVSARDVDIAAASGEKGERRHAPALPLSLTYRRRRAPRTAGKAADLGSGLDLSLAMPRALQDAALTATVHCRLRVARPGAAMGFPIQAKAEARDAPVAPGALPVSLRRALTFRAAGRSKPRLPASAQPTASSQPLRAYAPVLCALPVSALSSCARRSSLRSSCARSPASRQSCAPGPSSWRRRSCAPSCVRPARFCVPSFSRRARSSSRPCEDWPSS